MENTKNYHYAVAIGNMRSKAIDLHYQRYLEVGFFKHNEIDPYEANSTYFTVQELQSKKVVGVTRLIFSKLNDLPTIKNFHIFDIDKAKLNQLEEGRYAELSAFTKIPQHDVGLGLIRTVFQYSVHTGITHWICCIDERVYNYFLRIFKFPFQVIGEPKVYLGSNSIPCMFSIDECLVSLKQNRPPLYEYFTSITKESIGVIK